MTGHRKGHRYGLRGEQARMPVLPMPETDMGKPFNLHNMISYLHQGLRVGSDGKGYPATVKESNQYGHGCARQVNVAMRRGGFKIPATDARNAMKGYEDVGFVKQDAKIYKPLAGDIAITVTKVDGVSRGHIAMYDGHEWISDTEQGEHANPYGNKGNGPVTFLRNEYLASQARYIGNENFEAYDAKKDTLTVGQAQKLQNNFSGCYDVGVNKSDPTTIVDERFGPVHPEPTAVAAAGAPVAPAAATATPTVVADAAPVASAVPPLPVANPRHAARAAKQASDNARMRVKAGFGGIKASSAMASLGAKLRAHVAEKTTASADVIKAPLPPPKPQHLGAAFNA